MWYEIIALVLILLFYLFYKLYLFNYMETRRVFNLLDKTITARNILILKLLPEINIKSTTKSNILKLIQDLSSKDSGYTPKMYTDIELNKYLKELYDEIKKLNGNEVVRKAFKSIIDLEKKLINIRKEFNLEVEKYNLNLVKHKYMCMRIFKMKPLDKYNEKNKSHYA